MSEAWEAEDYLPSYETEDARRAWRRRTSLEMIISGCIGLLTSFVLSIEAWQLAADSSTRFSCDISSVLSCSTVAQTWQARILGFPNAFLGIFFEAVVLAISVAIFSGVKFPALVHAGHEPAPYGRVVLRVLALRAVVFHHSGAVPVVPAHYPDDDARVWHYPHQYP